MKICKVCMLGQSKYKCPTCLIPYCSLPCFKKHKVIPCSKPEPLEEDEVCKTGDSRLETNDDKPCYVDVQSEVLERGQLQSLASSNEIHDITKNEELRRIIRKVDSSLDPEKELEQAMEDESFFHLAQKILDTIGT